MSAANDKVSKDSMGLVMEFLSPNTGKVNGPNNYLAWTGAMHTIMGARYGPMARVFADQVPYVLPDLGPDDVPQAGDPRVEGLTAANVQAIRVSVQAIRALSCNHIAASRRYVRYRTVPYSTYLHVSYGMSELPRLACLASPSPLRSPKARMVRYVRYDTCNIPVRYRIDRLSGRGMTNFDWLHGGQLRLNYD